MHIASPQSARLVQAKNTARASQPHRHRARGTLSYLRCDALPVEAKANHILVFAFCLWDTGLAFTSSEYSSGTALVAPFDCHTEWDTLIIIRWLIGNPCRRLAPVRV